jgi:flagellar biosynthetic protein FliO
MWWDYLKAVFLIVLIIAAAYYVTRFVATKAAGTRSRAADIRIRSSAALGRDRQIVIAEIGGNAYILGVTAQHVELIDKMDASELDAKLPEAGTKPPVPDFKREFLERLKGTYRDPRQ